jgi:hypothetical protein
VSFSLRTFFFKAFASAFQSVFAMSMPPLFPAQSISAEFFRIAGSMPSPSRVMVAVGLKFGKAGFDRGILDLGGKLVADLV